VRAGPAPSRSAAAWLRASDLRAAVDGVEAQLTSRLFRLATPEQTRSLIEAGELVPDQGCEPQAGTRPCAVLRDGQGHQFIFKAAEPRLIAGEVFAFGVRRLARRPAVPTLALTFDLPGVGPSEGMIQPFLDRHDGRLEPDATAWSPLQREVMLREHPWEWLLANLDTHADQYVFIGPEKYPLNIDWDHSLFDLDITGLDRFTKRSPAIAPIRNALYDAYVHRGVDLDFSSLRREARRIARLDNRLIEPLLSEYATLAKMPADEAAALRTQFFARKRHLPRTFDRLVSELQAERHALRGPADRSPRALLLRAVHALRDAWQRLVITYLHDHVLAPVFRLYRRLLALGLRSHRNASTR
jgi:hypothetical protein